MTDSIRIRVLVDCGDYHLGNLGDVAMLQVTVERLREILPDASIQVVTHDAPALAMHCPHATPVPLQGRDGWLVRGAVLGRTDRLLRRTSVLREGGIEGALRRRWPSLLERLVRARLSRDVLARGTFDSFMEALVRADAVVLCGAGGITDHARVWAMGVLDLLEGAMNRGAVTAMFGHGLGPLFDPDLRRAAARVLPRLDLLALREGRAGPGLASELGVPVDRVVVSGDDAIELAYSVRATKPGIAIGLNLRVARSSGVDRAYIQPVSAAVRAFALARGAPLLGIPIGRGPASNDNATIQQLLAGYPGDADDGASLDTTGRVIAQVRRCRIVVSGAYHAAVFALAQGIPTICLARSAYFMEKMQGLAHQFPSGCTVIDLGAPDFAERLGAAMDDSWNSAPDVRPALLDAAARQVAASRDAYIRFAEIVRARAARATASPAGHRAATGEGGRGASVRRRAATHEAAR